MMNLAGPSLVSSMHTVARTKRRILIAGAILLTRSSRSSAFPLHTGGPRRGALHERTQHGPGQHYERRQYSSSRAAARLSISDSFDGGNVEHVATTEASEGGPRLVTVWLRIKPDVYSELERKAHSQYFCFKSVLSTTTTAAAEEEGKTVTVRYVIENAGQVSYPQAWQGSTAFVGTNLNDANTWRRALDTTYSPESGHLSWTVHHQLPHASSVYCCYFPPFSYQQHLELLAECSPFATRIESLGQTLDGRDMDCVVAGTGPLVCWIIHRQHPGEPMASYFARGLLHRLLGISTNGEVDGQVARALSSFTFYVVPLMCPDGAFRGHLRTNGVGANLNREWATVKEDYPAPSLVRSPEVYSVLRRMDQTGVDAFVDVHGDEELPFNFLSGSEGSLHWGSRLQALHGAFCTAYSRANSDMQVQVGYLPPPPGRRAALNIATNAIADRFDCLSVTLEMPFKDCLSNPNPAKGWSPNRASMLGASLIDALVHVHPFLRNSGAFWDELPPDDAYVSPTRKY
jgi:murein tripeptide amidase MpaA